MQFNGRHTSIYAINFSIMVLTKKLLEFVDEDSDDDLLIETARSLGIASIKLDDYLVALKKQDSYDDEM